MTGVYSLSQDLVSSPGRFTELFKFALSKTITRHPALCFGVVEKSENSDAHFFRLDNIHWDDVVEIQTPESQNIGSSDEGDDVVLCKAIGTAHQHLWDNQKRKPCWKIVVVKYANESESPTRRVDVIFVSHRKYGIFFCL